MWRLKHLIPKDQAGLEGKSVEVGSLKLQVRSVIAEGGFSSVYLARDAQTGKNYALKHIICNDDESLDLVHKEVSVMKSLRGHPNVVTLHAHSVLDNGRTKECFVVMDFCEKTLVSVLDGRGAGYFDEKQLLLIFRDICNAVFAMHSQSPPIAHRDLKAENVLLCSNGSWKLCDFGSTSTNHKRFERTEEMGLEEDIIRKHTTPAYRAPEMWDLYRRELISEKVDIWALGCLLYRLAFLKSAFDGESKLQILNGNYRIPDLPRHSDCVVNLIKDMLTANPDARPDITQVWRRTNEGLPSECRKSSPDRAPSSADSSEPKAPSKPAVPSRAPPPPPPSQSVKGVGSFWSTQYASEAKYDDETSSSRSNNTQSTASTWSADFDTANKSPSEVSSGDARNHYRKGGVANFVRRVQGWNKDESEGNGYTVMSSAEMEQPSEPPRPVHSESGGNSSKVPEVSNDGAFNAFVAEFDISASRQGNAKREDATPALHADVEKLKVQLQQALAEKMEFAGKYEKLTAICRSQRQEIQELKSVLAAATSNKEPVAKPPSAQSRRTRPEWHSSADQAKEKQSGSVWDLQGGLSSTGNPNSSQSSHTMDSQTWQAFGETLASKLPSGDASDGRRRQQQHSRAASVSGGDTWGFIQESMNSHQDAKISSGSGPGSSSFRATPRAQKPPAGWAGF